MKPNLPLALRRVIPSMVTMGALGAGMNALRLDIAGELERALSFLLLAMVLDALDGKLARLLNAVSDFGAELDTLSDFFNFGVVPGILIYHNLYADTDYASIGWIASLIVVVCCALRLARFNVARKTGESDDFFVGIPAPALACLALMPIFMQLSALGTPTHPFVRTVYIVGVGLLAISTIPTISIKYVNLRSSLLIPLTVVGIVGIYGLITNPWPTLVVANCLYLATLPFFYLKQSRQSKPA
ncbi:CDP-diacylglycerol--serine O-phosphatidyltransferase [Ruegeria aquimaris]|uniref:CDP-diacylglycerol--serine O-phosphatidyltransferase n=1 Tax=Ruegeria aquimaris TaxID=2984333 RepID=A0ABT3AII7_9RHOB|nr:CDP-diacylglycerol--serine O-phosphatidyltransferase [Ruegeria sp. XHP0148]MCV2888468.1 CDP-diacylglycerol--serine O-phosphatidyltransferase [Ruegeria sp. XHP0148]